MEANYMVTGFPHPSGGLFFLRPMVDQGDGSLGTLDKHKKAFIGDMLVFVPINKPSKKEPRSIKYLEL
jgi:hypothetical protein